MTLVCHRNGIEPRLCLFLVCLVFAYLQLYLSLDFGTTWKLIIRDVLHYAWLVNFLHSVVLVVFCVNIFLRISLLVFAVLHALPAFNPAFKNIIFGFLSLCPGVLLGIQRKQFMLAMARSTVSIQIVLTSNFFITDENFKIW